MSLNRSKALMLLLILGSPVLLYLFLQGFGENKYEVPVYFQEGIIETLPGCMPGKAPHTIGQFIQREACEQWDCQAIEGKLTIFSFLKSDCHREALNQTARVCNILREQESIQVITVALDTLVSPEAINEQIELYRLPEHVWSWWSYHPSAETLVKCGLQLNPECNSASQLVLIDYHKQIRGYYEVSDLKELDRLVTEYEILSTEAGKSYGQEY